MLTLHPMGIDHGPHPQAWERDRQGLTKQTNEYAIALDTVEPLFITREALKRRRRSLLNLLVSPDRDCPTSHGGPVATHS